MIEEAFTVNMLREALVPMVGDWEVWIHLKDHAGEVTQIKIGSLGLGSPKLILECSNELVPCRTA
jgi:hypothetical protein